MVGLATATVVMSLATFRFRVTAFVFLVILISAPLASFTILRARGISFIDPNEGSTAYRLVVWREALNLIRQHPLVGIGKGSDGVLKERFGLFDSGKLPPGHFHSSPIQIALWWGLPALACYAAFMSIFLLEGWRLSRLAQANNDRKVWGIALGTTGALVAFNVSSLVHWNFGDGEVVMALWLMAGLAFAVRRITLETRPASKAIATANLGLGHPPDGS
jgi:O-antigen ligase